VHAKAENENALQYKFSLQHQHTTFTSLVTYNCCCCLFVVVCLLLFFLMWHEHNNTAAMRERMPQKVNGVHTKSQE
jgi:hypothetical protein